ncbi:MAG TPA: PhzF family phenazine biosynthesis protein [Rhodanobacteraceae bacterium]|jgi:PhzF family phenazine biosynthesis protein|nr:PhzF family phenazine biosynthesis protein [Rhodanobacteraceae bacterium]
MQDFRYLQLDVFSARTGGGNPLGVVVDAASWTSERMQAFAAWTGLVETTFVLPPSSPEASYRLRIFTPSREIPFAGHPTIGSAHAVLQAGVAKPKNGRLLQECGAGLLPIRVEGEGASRNLFLQSPAAHVLAANVDDPSLKAALGSASLGSLPPAFVEGGRRWWIAEFADEAAVRDWQPDHATIGALARASDCLGLCVFARSQSPDYELVVRAFPAGVGIVEDPASGAANGLIAAWIAKAEPNGALARGYRVSQGREIGHDASILIRIEQQQIWVGGKTRTILRGRLHWPD